MSYEITLTDTAVSKIILAKWLKKVIGACTSKESLHFAAVLSASKVLRYNRVDSSEEVPFATVTFVSDYVDPHESWRKNQEYYFELRAKGAAGDAEAAIAYCRADAGGLVNHSATAYG